MYKIVMKVGVFLVKKIQNGNFEFVLFFCYENVECIIVIMIDKLNKD